MGRSKGGTTSNTFSFVLYIISCYIGFRFLDAAVFFKIVDEITWNLKGKSSPLLDQHIEGDVYIDNIELGQHL